MSKRDFGQDIAAIAACFGCSDTAARLLAGAMQERIFPPRAIVARGGDPATQLFLILEGAVAAEIYGFDGQQAQLCRHGPGEIFGAYPEVTCYRADIRSVLETRLLAVSCHELAALALTHSEIGAGIAGLLARQLDLMLDRMAARIGLSASGRFHKALLQLADESGHIRPAPVISALALSVHTTRETGSRALATLLRRGIVERDEAGLRIVSRRLLEELVI